MLLSLNFDLLFIAGGGKVWCGGSCVPCSGISTDANRLYYMALGEAGMLCLEVKQSQYLSCGNIWCILNPLLVIEFGLHALARL